VQQQHHAINADGTPGGVTVSMTGKNIGDLLNSARVTWGWFQGGFTPRVHQRQRDRLSAACNTSHENIGGAVEVQDYVEHHEPFQYYATRRTPTTSRPRRSRTSATAIGTPADQPSTTSTTCPGSTRR
jgi:phospholipase C